MHALYINKRITRVTIVCYKKRDLGNGNDILGIKVVVKTYSF